MCILATAVQLENIKYYETIDIKQTTRSDFIKDAEASSLKKHNTNINTYDDEPEFSFSGLGRNFHLKLQKNSLLLSPKAKIIKQSDNETPTAEKKDFEQCYYQGQLHGEDASTAVVSTCGDRLNGLIEDADGVEYVIAPYPDDAEKHMLYKSSDVVQKNNATYRCGIHYL